jgi:hypothetical protein
VNSFSVVGNIRCRRLCRTMNMMAMPRIDVVSFFDRIGCMVVLYCVVCVFRSGAGVPVVVSFSWCMDRFFYKDML